MTRDEVLAIKDVTPRSECNCKNTVLALCAALLEMMDNAGRAEMVAPEQPIRVTLVKGDGTVVAEGEYEA